MNAGDRLNPKIFHTRYVVLSQLRDKTLQQLKQLNLDCSKAVLVDFGCGDMPYKSVITPLVAKYIGVDLDINPKADHYIDFDSKTALPDGFADIILSNQVLEHVDSPSGYLREAYRLLKPGGTLLLTTHGHWFYHPTPNDYWRWTSAGLKKIVYQENFEIVSFEGILGLAASGIQLFQDAIAVKLPKFLLPVLALPMQFFIALFNKINTQAQRDRDGAVYILLAHKRI